MLKISRFNSDLGLMAFWGWDLIDSSDEGEEYQFMFGRRDNDDKIYVSLGKHKQYSSFPWYPEQRYQCFITDSEDIWQTTHWLTLNDLKTKESFYKVIEETLENHYQ